MPNSRACLCCFLTLVIAGCGGPSSDERENRKTFEMLLTAISIKSLKELEKDAKRLDERRSAGVLSEESHRRLAEIVERARAGDWGNAEAMAYAFREERPFFR